MDRTGTAMQTANPLSKGEARVIQLARRISRLGGVSTRTMAELREALAAIGVNWQRERSEWKLEVREALERLNRDDR